MNRISKADLALSTMWNFRKAHSGEQLIDQILELGFTQVELNYQVRVEWLPAIERAIAQGVIRAPSIHNVFPKTLDVRFDTDSMLLGYQDEDLRKQAVELTKGSIDWACRLGASAVVIHPTEVPLPPEQFDIPLKQLIAAHQTDTEAYVSLRQQMLAARDSAPYMSSTLRSLNELSDYITARQLPVKLGIENRAMCHQVPIFAEFEPVVRRFSGGPVGIWLDTGHGIMMQEMGLQQLPLSAVIVENIIGMHIHDAVDALDHYAPYTLPGNVLDAYLPYIKSSPIKVLELSGRLTGQEILTGTQNFIAHYNA